MKKHLIFLFEGMFIILLLISCGGSDNLKEESENSVDSCLAKYDFEGARKANTSYNKEEQLKKITIAEAKFWSSKGEYDKALKVVDETWGMDDYDWKENDWQSFRYSILEDGVDKLCSEKKDFSKAKILAIKAPENINVEGFKIGSGTGSFNDRGTEIDYNPNNGAIEIKAVGPSMREVLNKKIADYEALVNK